MPLAFVQCKLQQSRSALLLISRLTKKQHFPPAQGLSFSLTAQPLRRALAAQGDRKVKSPLLLSPASKWVPGFMWSGTGQHFHHALCAYTVYTSGLTCTLGWRRTAAAAEAPPHTSFLPWSCPGGTGGPRSSRQQTAHPAQAAALGHPIAQSAFPLSLRLSPAERLAFRQGREGSRVMGSYPQRRMVWKAEPVTASRTQRPLMGVLTRSPICPLPLLVCPSPGCGVWGERKGRTIG